MWLLKHEGGESKFKSCKVLLGTLRISVFLFVIVIEMWYKQIRYKVSVQLFMLF